MIKIISLVFFASFTLANGQTQIQTVPAPKAGEVVIVTTGAPPVAPPAVGNPTAQHVSLANTFAAQVAEAKAVEAELVKLRQPPGVPEWAFWGLLVLVAVALAGVVGWTMSGRRPRVTVPLQPAVAPVGFAVGALAAPAVPIPAGPAVYCGACGNGPAPAGTVFCRTCGGRL